MRSQWARKRSRYPQESRVLWLLLGAAAQLKGVSKGNAVTSSAESLNAVLVAQLLNPETRGTCTSPRKQEKRGI